MCEQTIAVLWFKSIILLSLRIILIFTTPSLRFFWGGGGGVDGGGHITWDVTPTRLVFSDVGFFSFSTDSQNGKHHVYLEMTFFT